MASGTKRLLALLLALILCVSLLPATALAEGEDEEAGTIAPVEEPAGDSPLDVPEDDPDAPAGDVVIADDPESLPPTDEANAVTSGKCGDDLTWSLTDDGVLTISGTGDMWDFDVVNMQYPPWWNYSNSIESVVLMPGLTSIGDFAMMQLNITSITIPDGVTSIGRASFHCCVYLESVTIPEGVTILDEMAFIGCEKLSDPVLPSSLRSIGELCFSECYAFKHFIVPDGVTSIGDYAFKKCKNMESISIPASVTSIDDNAFYNCTALTAIYYDGFSSDWYRIFHGSLPSGTKVYFSKLASGECGAEGDNLTWLLRSDGTLTISGTGMMKDYRTSADDNITPDAPWVSYAPQIKEVIVQEGVTSIGKAAFLLQCDNLERVHLPDSLESIGDGAFFSIDTLEYINIPGNVSDTGFRAFSHCPKLLTAGPVGSGCNVELGWTTSIPDSALQYFDYLEEITVPEGVTSIGLRAFYGCPNLKHIVIPGSVTSVMDAGLQDSVSLHTAGPIGGDYDIEFGWTESIPVRAFYGLESLTDVTFPSGLASIGDYSFDGCKGLTKVRFPETLASIGFFAFFECSSLAEVYYDGYEESAERKKGNGWDTAGNGSLFDATWYYAKTLEEGWDFCGNDLVWHYDTATRTITIKGSGPMWDFAYNDQPWKDYAGKLVGVNFEPGITTIGQYAFYNCGRLRTVEIPAGMTHIGEHAFQFCRQLSNAPIPESVISIDDFAFDGCSTLPSLAIPAGVTSIGAAAFRDCSGLESVTIPESVTGIGDGAFAYCTRLTDFVVDEQNPVFCVQDGVLFSADGKTLIQCPGGKTGIYVVAENVTSLGAGAFAGCGQLTGVTIPESVTDIGNWIFHECSSLDSITIPAGVNHIGFMAFANCGSLKNIVFLGGAPMIQDNSFTGVTANAYYPDDGSWWEDDLQDYGGKITWIPYTGEPMINVFGDVAYGKYYYEPVLWAYYHDPQITGGISETEFGPGLTCTREQIVTFLWKAMGAPEPKTTTNPFVDVPEGKWYYKPVLWAVEKGITGGMDATHFGVGKPCTREQAMTFLWKAMGAPEPLTDDNPFLDVPAAKYYYKAVLWAVENGITGGVDQSHFGVGKPCTRGQIVTFLYKAMAD